MGCRTATLARDAIMPVTAGNTEPPICPKTKTKAIPNQHIIYGQVVSMTYIMLKTGHVWETS